MWIKLVLGKHQDPAQRPLSEYLIISVKYLLQVMMPKCWGSRMVILVSIVAKELVQNVMDTGKRRSNFNSCLIPMFPVRFVRGKDTNLRFYELNEMEKLSQIF